MSENDGRSRTKDPRRSVCPCQSCLEVAHGDDPEPWSTPLGRMILCPTCGNKRCPHANHHDNGCTGSNEPDQPGSAYDFRTRA